MVKDGVGYLMDDPTDDVFLDLEAGDGPHRTLSLERAPTVLLVLAANRFTRSAARYYQRRFGVGAMDWRMLVMLTREPNIPVTRASQVIGIDKAAVSRSLARLEGQDLALATINGTNLRRRLWRLTQKGESLHREMLAVALERQRELLRGLSQKEVSEFSGFLKAFVQNVERLDA